MNTWGNHLFYIVFLAQIILVSYWLPHVILGRMKALMEQHPPSTHPKLYPQSIGHYRHGMAAFKWLNRVIFLLGFALLYGAYALDEGNISEAWPAAYGMLQFLPLVALELAGFRQFRLMREKNTRRTRSAELRPRRLLDYVSPRLLVVACVMFAGVVGFDLAANDFQLAWGSDAIQRDITMLATNVFLAILGSWHLYGRKLDPYQASDDRVRQVRVQLNSLLLVSTALSAFLIFQTADDVFEVDYLDATLMSLYFQAIFACSIGYLLRSIKPADLDFSVYTNDPTTEKK